MEPKTAERARGQRSTSEQNHEQLAAHSIERFGFSVSLDQSHRVPNGVPATGIPAGTIVLTMDGERPVEALAAEDRIITRDSGAVALINVTKTIVTVDAVRFAANSLGHRRPEEDTILPPDQKVLLRDWRAKALYGQGSAMVDAARLVDGEFVRSVPNCTLRLYSLHFTAPHVVYAGGLELGVVPLQPYAICEAEGADARK